jgi:DNA-binding FadR family transcriptional regulator
MDFSHVRTKSLTETFIDYVEHLIISGELASGEQLPPERELAERTGVSRPVVHESLVKLEAMGLVTIVPRHGVYVNDFKRTASLELLHTLNKYEQHEVKPKMLETLFDMRGLLEERSAALAALSATIEDLSELEQILLLEQESLDKGPERMAEADFQFHHTLAIASGEILLPLIMNSFRPLYALIEVNLYQSHETGVEVFTIHRSIIDAIMAHDAGRARQLMQQQLTLSRERLVRDSSSGSL